MEAKNISYLKKEDNADVVAVLQPQSGEMANTKCSLFGKKYCDFVSQWSSNFRHCSLLSRIFLRKIVND